MYEYGNSSEMLLNAAFRPPIIQSNDLLNLRGDPLLVASFFEHNTYVESWYDKNTNYFS
jgi:hypothetical protein